MKYLLIQLAKLKVCYQKITNYFYNLALYCFEFNYSEAKLCLFIHHLLKMNLKDYYESSYELHLYALNKIEKFSQGKGVLYNRRSKLLESMIIYLRFFKYWIIFPPYPIIKFLTSPFFKIHYYFEKKKLKRLYNEFKSIQN